jgi:hypothetical protein
VGVWSEGLQREAVFLSGAVPSFELAKIILNRIGQINISQVSAWRCTQEAGARFQAVEAAEQVRANALPEQWEPPSRAEVADQRMGVSMDGASIHIRKEGWKDVRIRLCLVTAHHGFGIRLPCISAGVIRLSIGITPKSILWLRRG